MKAPRILSYFSKFFKSLNKDIPTKIYSIVIAVIVWFVVSSTLYPDISQNVQNVPVEIATSQTNTVSGLSIISQDTDKIDVRINGNRSSIGNVKASDLKASVSIENITEPGKYQLPVEVTSKSGKVFSVLSRKPETVTVVLDKIVSKTFDIVTETPNIKAEENYQKSDAVSNPSVVTITGPEQKINQITKCVVRNTESYTLKESTEIVSGNTLIIYNDSTVLSQEGLTVENSAFSLQVPIYMKKVLPLKPTFQNVPSGFPIDKLKYTIDVPEIEVAAPNDMLANQGEIHLCYIDLHKVDIGTTITAPIVLSDGYRNLSGASQATVTFDSTGLKKKIINIKAENISVINAPENYTITPITSGYDIPFIGPEDVIKNLTIQDVVVQLDLSSVSFTGDDYFNAPISIFVPDKGLVWTYGSYTATFRAKAKS